MSKLSLKQKVEEAYKRLDEVVVNATDEAQKAVAKSMKVAIGKNLEYADAYHSLIMTLTDRIIKEGGLRISTLERITREIKARNGKEKVEDKKEEKLNLVQKTHAQKNQDAKRIDYNQYKELRKTLSYAEVTEQFPNQDLRGYEGARGRYGTERTEKAPKNDRKELPGSMYRQLFEAKFGTKEPGNVSKEDVAEFDSEILKSYKVSNGKSSLRAYRAWFHRDSWTKN
jgi:hypothetical protein